VVPVVDVNSENGPTEFLMGSHTNVPAFSDKDREQPTRSFPIPANKGDAVIFDIRIRHRGTPNNSPKVRPIIYMSYVAAWYRDEVNFKLPQSFKWDEQFKTVAARKLFMRVDQQR
jgi:ectoine hydroxylase-related dioxygenase (phytanoyl-CoA dioxygenase family)